MSIKQDTPTSWINQAGDHLQQPAFATTNSSDNSDRRASRDRKINFVDDLDSKINGVQTHIDKEPDREGNWTSYHRLYDRYFYKGSGQAEVVNNSPQTAAVSVPPEPEKKPQREKRQRYDKPLAATLGDQLKEKNLDLFSTITEKGDNS